MNSQSNFPVPSVSQAVDDGLARLMEQVSERLQQGEAVDLPALTAEHPDHADTLRRLLPAMEVLAGLNESAHADGADTDHIAGRELGDFQIHRELGRGGMGIVYEATQLSLRRRVALKVLPFAAMFDPRHLQRFHNEAYAASQLHHPHIVPVYAVGMDRGVHYFAMQLIEGQSIAQLLAAPGVSSTAPTTLDTRPIAALSTRGARPSADYFRAVARLGMQAAEALEHAHQTGIVHRDIKPANLLIDARGSLWITDFGLATLPADHSLTLSGDVIGTLRYMSPEQITGQAGLVDHRTDIYSLGVTLYELITGQPLVAANDRATILRHITEEDPPPIGKFASKCPRDLETIVLTALAKRPQDRYPTAQRLAEDLSRFLQNQPIRAQRPGYVQRAVRWTWRHRMAVTTALVTALVSLSFSVGLIARAYQAERLQRQAAEALTQRTQAAERKATEEAQVSAAINRFLQQDLLGLVGADAQFDAQLAPDPDLKVCVLLDRARATLGERFADQPRVRTELLATLADAYESLGIKRHAVTMWTQIVDYRREALGPDAAETLAAMERLAIAYRDADKASQALELQQQVVDRRQRVFGNNHDDTLSARVALADFVALNGDRTRAVQMLEEVLAERRHTWGERDVRTLSAMNALAVTLLGAGQHDRALTLHQQALDICREVKGAEHPITISLITRVAVDYHALRQFDQAIAHFQSALELETKLYGPSHAQTAWTRGFLAGCYFDLGQFDRAADLFEETVKSNREKLGDDDLRTRRHLFSLAEACHEAGRLQRAREVGEELITAIRKQAPERPVELTWGLLGMAETLLELEAFTEIEPLMRECLSLEGLVPGFVLESQAKYLLGASLRGQQRFAEAEPLLLDAYEKLKPQDAAIAAKAREQLIRLYEDSDRPEEAQRWRAKQ